MHPILRLHGFVTTKKHVRLVILTLLSSVTALVGLGLYQGSLTQAQGSLPVDADDAPTVTVPLEVSVAPERQTVPLNDPASFTITLKNTGGSTLTAITVTDSSAPDCSRAAGSLANLAPGGSLSYTCQSPTLTADLVNDISASASNSGSPVNASARAFVDINSVIKISIQPLQQFALLGQTVTFTVTLSNLQTGQTLTNFSVAAPNVPDCSRASGVLPDLAAGASLSYTCQIQTSSNQLINQVTASVGGSVSPVDADPPTMVATATAGAQIIYVPTIFKTFTSAPDLVVDNLVAASGAVTVTIRNAGTAVVVDSFWVDVYFNPGQSPSLNQPWKTTAPAGAVWGVTQSLAAGESLSLTTGGTYYFGPPESSALPFPSGVPVYTFVDSVNYNTSYGNVQERQESNNVFGPIISTATESPLTLEIIETPVQQGLPGR